MKRENAVLLFFYFRNYYQDRIMSNPFHLNLQLCLFGFLVVSFTTWCQSALLSRICQQRYVVTGTYKVWLPLLFGNCVLLSAFMCTWCPVRNPCALQPQVLHRASNKMNFALGFLCCGWSIFYWPRSSFLLRVLICAALNPLILLIAESLVCVILKYY